MKTRLCVALILLCLCGVSAAEELPLPADVSGVHGPYEVIVGAQPIRMEGFETALSVEHIRTFFEQALPKQGWQLGPLPWVPHVKDQREALQRTVQQHPELTTDPTSKAQLESAEAGLARLNEHTKQFLYAIRGHEQVLLNFSPQGQSTLVFINRWDSAVPALPGSEGVTSLPGAEPCCAGKVSAQGSDEGAGRALPSQEGWPAVNPCCSGESVSGALRKLPSSIPQYPSGRMVTTGAVPMSSADRKVMSEMYLTADSVDQVVEYYQKHMAYNGWFRVEGPATGGNLSQFLGPQAAMVNATLLMFRQQEGNMCGVVVVERPSGQGGDSNERTLIFVNYIESPMLGRSLRYVPPRSLTGTKR